MTNIACVRQDLSEERWRELLSFRYDVFVNRLRWSLPLALENAEEDQFDTRDAIYVLSYVEDGELVGCARLLPTNRPYLLRQLAGNDLCATAFEEGRATWELSRFATSTGTPPTIAKNLFLTSLEVARACGAQQVVGIVSRGLERRCRAYGTPLTRIARPRILDGQQAFPVLIKLE